MKRIVFCADGTWDTVKSHTNVYKLFNALAGNAGQVKFYDDGVGADGNPVSKLLGGAFGTGLWQKIKDGYSKIAHVYEAGDLVYVFGFSRGAYTARSLAGMIAVCGLPAKSFSDSLVDTAFDAYRDPINRAAKLATLKDSSMDDAQIGMVGVWDTVGSLGIPAAVGLSDPLAYGFLDTSLHQDVKAAYQALAIDEKRLQFPPTLWTKKASDTQILEQVWFCGVHSDVGGGEPDSGPGRSALSDITLAWMMDRASKQELQFDAGVLKQYQIPLDPVFSLDTLHSSWNILWGIPRERSIATDAVLANSVGVRLEHDSSYRPPKLSIKDGILAATYGADQVVHPPEAAEAAGRAAA